MITDQGMDKIAKTQYASKVEELRDHFASTRVRLLEEHKMLEENYNKMAHDFQVELDSLNDRIAMLNRALDDYPEQKTMNAPSNYDRH